MVYVLVPATIEALAALPISTLGLSVSHIENDNKDDNIGILNKDILIGDSMVSPIDDHQFYGWQPPISAVVVL